MLTTRQVLEVARRLGLDLDHERLKTWHRRGVVDMGPAGHGNEREYTIRDTANLMALAWLADLVGLHALKSTAASVADAVMGVYETGPDGDVAQAVPPQAVVIDAWGEPSFRQLRPGITPKQMGQEYAWRRAIVLDTGQMALELWARVRDVLAEA